MSTIVVPQLFLIATPPDLRGLRLETAAEAHISPSMASFDEPVSYLLNHRSNNALAFIKHKLVPGLSPSTASFDIKNPLDQRLCHHDPLVSVKRKQNTGNRTKMKTPERLVMFENNPAWEDLHRYEIQ